ncbi:hypothetical protein [Sphingomonas sp. 28-63-12]|uniref:hypothetical protein n=1 Tax=Sphingomonas sp. 28-63-12 TaxID=1970434 RepID=UPI000BCCCF81|nr:MAG: hypothetical protein B7Y47_13385 [Sphingomonas sp. 28-63-12]
MKRTFILTGLALMASPAFAQTAPAPTTIPDTALSTETTPSTGPRSLEADLPSNTATPQAAMPAPALDHYPICKAGEFDHCMEPGNGPAKKHRWAKHPR